MAKGQPRADPDGDRRDGPVRRARARVRQRRGRDVRPRPEAGCGREGGDRLRHLRRRRSSAGCSRCRARTRPSRSTPICVPRAGRAPWSGRWRRTRPTTRAGPRCGRRRRCCGPIRSVVTPELCQSFRELIDPLRYPANGVSERDVMEIRRIKARVDAERLPRGADPATHTKLGRGGSPTSSGRSSSSSSARRTGSPASGRRARSVHWTRPSRPAWWNRPRRTRCGRVEDGLPDPQRDHAGPRPSQRLPPARPPRPGRGRPDLRLPTWRIQPFLRRLPPPDPPRLTTPSLVCSGTTNRLVLVDAVDQVRQEGVFSHVRRSVRMTVGQRRVVGDPLVRAGPQARGPAAGSGRSAPSGSGGTRRPCWRSGRDGRRDRPARGRGAGGQPPGRRGVSGRPRPADAVDGEVRPRQRPAAARRRARLPPGPRGPRRTRRRTDLLPGPVAEEAAPQAPPGHAPFVRLVASRSAACGTLHLATDWADYAERMLDLLWPRPSRPCATSTTAGPRDRNGGR